MNKPTQHTPAPWVFPSKYATHLVDCNCKMIADVPQPNWMSDEEHQANKCLICAAPDLLDALEYVLNEYVDRHDNSETAIKARAAIAKAKTATSPTTNQHENNQVNNPLRAVRRATLNKTEQGMEVVK